MPDCHRCERTFPTAEVRRTSKGYVCKDSLACKRRLSLTRGAVIEMEKADALAVAYRKFDSLADKNDPLAALAALSELATAGSEAAYDIVKRAARETNLTNKQIAQALGVPTSTLRGLRA